MYFDLPAALNLHFLQPYFRVGWRNCCNASFIASPGCIWLSVTPVDLCQGIEGLSGLVQQSLGYNPCAGSAFVFRNASEAEAKDLSIEDRQQLRLEQSRPAFQSLPELLPLAPEWIEALKQKQPEKVTW